eukprot:6566431-Ditylum_brightwellii.AAC.1
MKSAGVTLADHVANVEATMAALMPKKRKTYSMSHRSMRNYLTVIWAHGRIFHMILNFKTAQICTTADQKWYQ